MAANDRSQILRSSLGTAFATLASRVLGLLRTALEARVLGGGAVASGWRLAVAIANLSRRLLGEGALGTALIPLIAETEKTGGRERVRRELGVVFPLLGALLALIVLVIGGGAFWLQRATDGCGGYFGSMQMQLCLKLLPVLMPYTFFICLVGVAGAVLNYSKVFVLPALGALLLNIFMIGGLAAIWSFSGGRIEHIREYLPLLAILVLISGALQLVLMLFLLAVYGRFPRCSLRAFRESDIWRRLWRLALPGMIGAAALQVSFLVDQGLASKIGAQAIPALGYVHQIIDVPIGIFALSLGTVLMAAMARSALEGGGKLAEDLAFGLRHVYFVCMPLAVLVVLFHEPMLRLLCRGGNYTEADLNAAHLVAVFYGIGIPCFCSIKVLLPAFYARKIMDKPFYCSLAAISLNIVLNLLLMWPLKQGGIALATTISSLVNNLLLLILLRRDGVVLRDAPVLRSGARSLILAVLTGGVGFFAYRMWRGELPRPWFTEFWMFLAAAAGFAVLYWGGTTLCRAVEPREFIALLRRRRK